MRIIVMRHGATAGNEAHRYVGMRSDEPLSDTGRAQCLRAGVFPQVPQVCVSPLRRASESARLCFPRARMVVVPGLEEYDFGAFEGRSAAEMADDAAYRAWVDGGCRGRCPGGESREDFARRSNAAFARVVRAALARGEDQLVMVAHGGTIMAAFQAFADARAEGASGFDDYFCWQVGPAEGYAATAWEDAGALRLADVVRFSRLPL